MKVFAILLALAILNIAIAGSILVAVYCVAYFAYAELGMSASASGWLAATWFAILCVYAAYLETKP